MKLGTNDIGSVYLGSNAVSSVYLGTNLVWSGMDADYKAILDYATTQGYTLPSASQQLLQEQLLIDLKDAGIWSKLDTFAVFATDGDSDFALIDWKRLTDYTAVNSPTFTTNVGFQGNGTSSYIDSNYNASTSGVNYLQNDWSFGWYMATRDALVGTEIAFGAAKSGDANWVRYSAKRFYYNLSSQQAYSGLTIGSNQMVIANASSTNLTLYANGSLTDNLSNINTKNPANTNFLAFYQTFATGYSDPELGMVYAGGNLDSQASAFYTAWNNYYTSL
jgi:hypothetical protein